MNKPELPSIPVFKLYGESLDWPTPDLLHCETISSRSREHEWEIKPHRHADLCQLLFVFKGQAELEIEGQRTQLDTPAIQVLPPLSVHGFRFSEDVEGFIVTLATPLINHLQAQLGGTVDGLQALGNYPAGKDSDYLNHQFARLQDEYADDQPARDMMLHALVSVLLVWVSRQAIQRRHSTARQPLETNWVTPCSTIAGATATNWARISIRISPPAMPNRPDRNAVATISNPSAAIRSGVISNLRRQFCLACTGGAN
mgnify:CR=1 FL=1